MQSSNNNRAPVSTLSSDNLTSRNDDTRHHRSAPAGECIGQCMERI